jgi:hypothetical protein
LTSSSHTPPSSSPAGASADGAADAAERARPVWSRSSSWSRDNSFVSCTLLCVARSAADFLLLVNAKRRLRGDSAPLPLDDAASFSADAASLRTTKRP